MGKASFFFKDFVLGGMLGKASVGMFVEARNGGWATPQPPGRANLARSWAKPQLESFCAVGIASEHRKRFSRAKFVEQLS